MGSYSMSDLKWNMRTYECSLEQNRQLGLTSPAEDKEENAVDEAKQQSEGSDKEVFRFPSVCSRCTQPLVTRMKRHTESSYLTRLRVLSIEDLHI